LKQVQENPEEGTEMTRISAKTTKILAAVTLLGGAIAGVNCTKGNNNNAGNGAGLLRLALTTGGVTVSTVHYHIVKSDMTDFTPPIQGDINTSDMNATPSVAHSVPASQGDIAILTATTMDAKMLPCTGQSAGFNVVAGQETGITVNLICGGSMTASTQGTVYVNGQVVVGDNCPALTSWMASPLQTSAPNGLIDVSAAASDADTTETLTYAWTASNGSFTDPSKGTTQYKCTTVGMQTLTITVTDNHMAANPLSQNCSVSQILKVNCASTVFCGNGTVDPGTTEQCDPPTPGFCDANCQNIPPKCGDTIVQAGEQCDPPNPGFCDANCQNVAPKCGDGFVQTGETCDPPNLATCTGSSCCDTTCHLSNFDINPTCQACEQKTYGGTNPAKFTCVQSLYSTTAGFGCYQFTGQALTDCLALRACIISTKCSGTYGYNANDPTPCYCGNQIVDNCANGGPLTDGSAKCLAQYQKAYADGHPTGAATAFDYFTTAGTNVGVANNLISCDIDAQCACGQ
jgi:hypothetical protein